MVPQVKSVAMMTAKVNRVVRTANPLFPGAHRLSLMFADGSFHRGRRGHIDSGAALGN
jgi:hypothetical protein